MNQSSIQQHFLVTKHISKRFRPETEDIIKKSLKLEEKSKIKSLLTPISQIPSLSSATLQVISSLQPSKIAPSIDKILSNTPAKQKYSDLLSLYRSFPLPYHYKKLVSSLEVIDKAITYLTLINQDLSFSCISEYVQTKCHSSITLETLQQILYVFQAYTLSWVRRNGKEYNLLLQFNNNLISPLQSDLLYKRKQELHTRLLNITSIHYQEFLDKNNLTPGTDTWHTEFQLNQVPIIKLAELPPKEQDVKSIANSEVVPRNALINSVFSEMQQVKVNQLDIVEPSITLIQENHAEDKKKRLISLCESLKSVFSSNNTPSMFYNNLAKKIKVYENSFKSDLSFICEMFPQWISCINTSSGNVVRVNRSFTLTLKSIAEEINKRFS